MLRLPWLQLPFGGRLCRSTLSNPGAGEVIERLHGWAWSAAALLNPLSPIATTSSPSRQVRVRGTGWRMALHAPGGALVPVPTAARTPMQEMCCAVNLFSLAWLGIIAPLYLAFHFESQARQLFLRSWWRRHQPGDAALVSSSSGSSSLSRSISSGGSASEEEMAAATASATAVPPLVLGRRRHRRLVQRLEELQCDPSMAAEREQEVVTELLRQRRPRAIHWVVAEMLFITLLAWPLSCLLVSVAGGWVCAAGE